MNQLKLFKKKIVISAAADGIGWAIAQACMKNGAIVFITDRDVSALEKISKHELYQKQFFSEVVNTHNHDEVEKYFKFSNKKEFFFNIMLLQNFQHCYYLNVL